MDFSWFYYSTSFDGWVLYSLFVSFFYGMVCFILQQIFLKKKASHLIIQKKNHFIHFVSWCFLNYRLKNYFFHINIQFNFTYTNLISLDFWHNVWVSLYQKFCWYIKFLWCMVYDWFISLYTEQKCIYLV